MPNKGKTIDVHNGVLDKKIKRSLLIALAFNARTLAIIGVVPPLYQYHYPDY